MPLLLLIRHGESEFSRRGRLAGRLPGIHLNPNGRVQADRLAQSLSNMPIRAIYSSPLERAMETAKPIAAGHHLPINKAPGLIETDVGNWEGKSLRRVALSKYWRVVQQSPSRARHPDGESFVQTQARVVQAIETICAAHKPRDVIACVFHSDPIKMAIAHYVGLPLDHIQRLGCDPASVSLLQMGASSARLIWLNRQPPFELPPAFRRG